MRRILDLLFVYWDYLDIVTDGVEEELDLGAEFLEHIDKLLAKKMGM